MPNCLSAKKRVRQTAKRTARNRARKERLRKAIKSFNAALAQEGADAGTLKQELQKIYKVIDKAGDKGILHGNAANRKKARLAQAVNRTLAGSAA